MNIDSEKQKKLDDFINNHVERNQTYLVEKLMEEEIISIDEIQNYYKSDEALKEDGFKTKAEREEAKNRGEDVNEVLEWWLVSDWLIERLEEKGEPILKTDYETWWGRTTSGQAIILDYVIEKIYDEYIN